MRSVPRITRRAITQYIEKINPNLPRGTAENRLKIAVGNLASKKVFTDDISYEQITIGNGHDARFYLVFERNEVVGTLTKQEYGEQYRYR